MGSRESRNSSQAPFERPCSSIFFNQKIYNGQFLAPFHNSAHGVLGFWGFGVLGEKQQNLTGIQ